MQQRLLNVCETACIRVSPPTSVGCTPIILFAQRLSALHLPKQINLNNNKRSWLIIPLKDLSLLFIMFQSSCKCSVMSLVWLTGFPRDNKCNTRINHQTFIPVPLARSCRSPFLPFILPFLVTNAKSAGMNCFISHNTAVGFFSCFFAGFLWAQTPDGDSVVF